MSAMQAVEDRELERDWHQGGIWRDLREAMESGDDSRIRAACKRMEETLEQDAVEHELLEREVRCVRGHLGKISQRTNPLAARLEDGRCRGGIARVTTLLEAGS